MKQIETGRTGCRWIGTGSGWKGTGSGWKGTGSGWKGTGSGWKGTGSGLKGTGSGWKGTGCSWKGTANAKVIKLTYKKINILAVLIAWLTKILSQYYRTVNNMIQKEIHLKRQLIFKRS